MGESGVALAVLLAVVCLLGAVAGPVAAKERSADASVIGGRAASIAELPWLAFVQSEMPGGGSACTATVVAPRILLTAGHCVSDLESGSIYKPSRFIAITGVADLRSARRADETSVSQVLLFPRFKASNLHGDAALLVLSEPVAAPALPLASVADAALYEGGTDGRIAGWGIAEAGSDRGSYRLQVAGTSVAGAGLCKREVARFYPFYSTASQLCALGPPEFITTVCQGDSGGPLIATRPDGTPVQIGITSLGRGDCETDVPGVFTRVDAVSEWVAGWIAAVETGAAAPPIFVPSVHLPFLPRYVAKELVGRTLREDLGGRFRRGWGKRASCVRVAREKVKCGVSWFQGPNDYWGTVTIYLRFREDIVVWDSRYRIRWVNDHCWFSSGHRRSCPIATRTR